MLATETADTVERSETTQHTDSLNLLVVDDESAVRESCREVAESLGFVTYAALRTAGWATGWLETDSMHWLRAVDLVVLAVPTLLVAVTLARLNRETLGKAAYVRQRMEPPAAILCTATVDSHRSPAGARRYMLGREPVDDDAVHGLAVPAEGTCTLQPHPLSHVEAVVVGAIDMRLPRHLHGRAQTVRIGRVEPERVVEQLA